ncbi:Saccharopine dehydrogenase-domain-containing protein [Desarmillaria tabescens]|uniref:Saccharopine dehydrogenase-domain-containing protein n=1 Tax=Armillaria tabescens TaxID=1929756 RepID=A0AA39JLK1_ARMTA|nr:Saccharopine dehydrogenase-domain-containing protein [Desarmillaria tabescens]KAK0445000.1 Saccharopine dehydrogenase-domain-containing protein [Desarmillaria tabescens]
MKAVSRVLRPLTVGIRREDPGRIWERRAPLTPEAVQDLVTKQGVQVQVESCDRRIFTDDEYLEAGASIRKDLSAAHILLGIKEPLLNSLQLSPVPSPISPANVTRTYMMFSHTAKGQSYNLPLLSSFLGHKELSRLIDFELLTDTVTGKRTVGFGWYAGVAGVFEALSSMAHSHLEFGVASPFLFTPRPHTQPSLDHLRAALRAIGARIATEGTPKALGPFVVGLTGTGNVAEGCLSALSELPIVKVAARDLPALVKDPEIDLRKIYLVHALPSDYFTRLDGGKYTRDHYYAHPNLYSSNFAQTIAPYLTLFLNGAGWAPGYPRIMTDEQLSTSLTLAQEVGGARFTNIGDISCDPEGGLQFLTHATTLSAPSFKARPASLPQHLPSVTMMAVDILPSSIPLDASRGFSRALVPYLEALIASYKGDTSGDRIEALNRATIANKGELAPQHQWLQERVDAWRASTTRSTTSSHGHLKAKHVLMFGSGMVAGPTVDKLAERSDVRLVIVSNSRLEMKKLRGNHYNVQYREIDMGKHADVSRLVEESDVVISLLPAHFHPIVAEHCIQHKKHMITASYISDSMKALHFRALDSNVLLLNEIGLDPGIDHCSAISLISRLQAQNKKVVSFISFCGGLPAPDVDDMGPLKYKFSWSPRGVLTAALNSAKFKLFGEEKNITGTNLLRSHFPQVPVMPSVHLEGYANRDSLPYAASYHLGPVPKLRTLVRGTLRYPGYSERLQFFKDIGLLELNGTIALKDWIDFVPLSQKLKQELHPEDKHINLQYLEDDAGHLEALRWLLAGRTPPLPTKPMAPLDVFTVLLAYKLQYAPHEHDMVVLSHEFITKSVSEPLAPEEVHTSSLVAYGDDKYSAMARTVGLPVALAALEVLDGKVSVRGVAGPGDASIREPVLAGMESVGLGMEEISGASETVEKALQIGVSDA